MTEKIQWKWFQLAVSSCYRSSSYTRDSTVFFEFICCWSVKKNKVPPHADRFSPPLKIISNTWVGIKKDQNSQCFQFSPFDLIVEDRMPLSLYSPLAYPSIKNYNHFRLLNLSIKRCLPPFLLLLTSEYSARPVILVVPLPVDLSWSNSIHDEFNGFGTVYNKQV